MLILVATIQFSFAENVTFKSNSKNEDGTPVILTGILTKPKGDGPFPAIILLHGCGGMHSKSASNAYNAWASRLVSWGYVTLQVDSLEPRGKMSVCGNPFSVHAFERMHDAYAGKLYLKNHWYVDNKRIAVMGWSHGGWTTLYTVDKNRMDDNGAGAFRASIAFYPYCEFSQIHLNAPLLILIGGEDDWTPAHKCKSMELVPESTEEITLKVYPKAYHGFDFEGIDITVKGHKIKYDSTAATDAISQVMRFFEKHLQ